MAQHASVNMIEPPSPSIYSPQQPSPQYLQVPDAGSTATSNQSTRPLILSRQTSTSFPAGDFRNQTTEEVNDIKCEVMVNWLHSQQEERLWFADGVEEGVVLKKSRGMYTCSPSHLSGERNGLFTAVRDMNVKVALTINTSVIRILLKANPHSFVEVQSGLRIQVLPNYTHLPNCQKHHFAAFIKTPPILVVWDDEPQQILARAEKLEKALMKKIWGNESAYPEEDEKKEILVSEGSDSEGDGDVEMGEEKPRRIVLVQAWLTGFTLFLCLIAIGAGYREIAVEVYVDGNYLRVLFILAIIPQFWLSLFFFQALAGNIAQIIGPVSQMSQNTKFFSGIAPRRLNRDKGPLPHLTIQCPVYKEGLYSVIAPTVHSLKAAISTYEMQGGSANIFVNDDGIQLISEDDARARREFYDEHNIGWTARPRHDPTPSDGDVPFLRRGKFKKASNMNYGLWVSQRIEEKLATKDRSPNWSQIEESEAYREALAEVIQEDEGRTWADGNVRMGDYILLVDSDTRVPTDCFLDAVSEMEQSPQVAIIQYSSGVMNVTDSFFERGITFFTNLVYTQIRYAVANGDVAPFVGHNAVLRWSAVQEIAYECEDDKKEKYWSEATVSEDFDMALRLQTHGYLVRLAAYAGDGFKEGVSLTVYDELARWEKYAYGCNELIFHPIAQWFRKGPLTPLFRNFFCSSMPFPSKLTILAYIGTYYALGSAWILTLMNYFVSGWFNGAVDHYYLDSFKVLFSIIIVFSALGNISLGVLRYRLEEQPLGAALWENFKWIPLMSCFLGGISLHVSQALLSHMFGVDMTWGATSKEAEQVTFFEEIPRVLKRFKWTFMFCGGVSLGMVAMATVSPVLWRIDIFIAVFPLGLVVGSHFLLPITLNPNLMLFTW
ncbi:hypothetical protein EJ08DRAFT_699638 [Tothia fuscella]|uniref:Glycosyltransferase 2-like domain-containing protein n=1 Tax=Tothia fuscella TaxID=1048955 RepID=A0A9P4TVD6_9PEZI|nr:hypothetical protein EJ08DRAFT_699638 [Tothia fuscella]